MRDALQCKDNNDMGGGALTPNPCFKQVKKVVCTKQHYFFKPHFMDMIVKQLQLTCAVEFILFSWTETHYLFIFMRLLFTYFQ